MISLEEYIGSPCSKLSIPYWKYKAYEPPEDMKIVHDDDFSARYLRDYTDERYFRLRHDLKNINYTSLSGLEIVTATPDDIDTIVSVINRSYTDLQVTASQIEGYAKTPVYDPQLWVLVIEKNTGVCAGCGIADFDKEAGEAVLEWIQVLPAYRRRKIGSTIVNELLNRAKGRAEFATVSGKADDKSNPQALYRGCGFTGDDIWHVLRIK